MHTLHNILCEVACLALVSDLLVQRAPSLRSVLFGSSFRIDTALVTLSFFGGDCSSR